MESFFVYVIKELAKQVGPVGGLLIALVLFLYFYERKSREALADKLFELAVGQTKAMTEFNSTLEAIERGIDHGFEHTDHDHRDIKADLERIQSTKRDW